MKSQNDEKDMISRIYRVSAGSELASALGEQALGSFACLSTESAGRMKEVFAPLLDVLPSHNSSDVARRTPGMTSAGRSTILLGGQAAERRKHWELSGRGRCPWESRG